jgi:hypothetical protein
MQRIEHYEIAAYGTDVALAEALGEKEVAGLLAQTLEEEKQTDLKLTEVTQQAIMPAAKKRVETTAAAAVPAGGALPPDVARLVCRPGEPRALRAFSGSKGSQPRPAAATAAPHPQESRGRRHGGCECQRSPRGFQCLPPHA